MKTKPLIPVIVIQFLPLLVLPPEILFTLNGAIAALILILLFVGLGYALLHRKVWALNLSIFLQGLNVIIRLMMLFPSAMGTDGLWNIPFVLTSLLSIALSTWFLLRLDKSDFHALVSA